MRERAAEALRRGVSGSRSKNYPADSLFQYRGVEVQQQSNLSRRDSQVSQYLCNVHWFNPSDALYFHHHSIRDNQIRSVLGDEVPLVKEWDADLASKREARVRQFDAQRRLVRRFQQSGAQAPMHLDRASEDALADIAFTIKH